MLALVAMHAAAQRYTFRHYGSQDGLGNLAINCLLQDKAGYIWAGTDNGLFRYDGGNFQVFSHAQGLPNTEIRAIAESPSGVMWVVTQGGLARREGNRFVSVPVGSKGLLRGIGFDGGGHIYLRLVFGILRGTSDAHGGYQFAPIVTGEIGGMRIEGTDVWFTRGGDLWRWTVQGEEKMGSPAGLPVDRWRSIERDSEKNLWVRSSTQLYELPEGHAKFIDRSQGLPHGARGLLYADARGRLLVSTDAGVVLLDGNTRTYIDAQHGLPIDNAGPALVDREGSLWIGLLGGGLVRRLGQGVWLSWKREDGLLGDSVWAVHHDSNGLLWVGTGSGLSILDANNRVTHAWSSHDGLPGDEVRSMIAVPGGDIFVGLSPVGISRFNRRGELLKSYVQGSGITDQIISMVVDHEGRMWAVGGESCFRSTASINAPGELKFDRVIVPGTSKVTQFHDLALDEKGVVWIASSQGLVRFDGKWKMFSEADGLRSSDPDAIALHNGSLWISYRDALGITELRFHGDAIEPHTITKEDGLSSDLIYAISFDHSGRLWATTDNGVDVFDNGRWHHYGTEDGIIWDDADDLALSVDENGDVWVGTSDGLSRYSASADTIPATAPAVVLTAIQGSTRSFAPSDKPLLPHAENSLLIRYSALSYANETRTRFRYRLLGSGAAWTETHDRSVRFDGLSAGSYTFEVAAASADGQWTQPPTRFAFTVRPSWWQSWWFLLLAAAAALMCGYAVWQIRVRRLVAQKELLERQVAERTEELRQSHRQLEEFAFYDMLTSLPNRRLFTDRFRAELALANRRHLRFALLLVDLDRFKQVNDTFGHDAGDEVLKEAAVRLQLAIRESDCVARLGGDEFAVLLLSPEGQEGVETVCSRIVESFQEAIPFNDIVLHVSCSVGVAMYPGDGCDQESLYKCADIALYEAKRAGRNMYRSYGSAAVPAVIPPVMHGAILVTETEMTLGHLDTVSN
jgi:diguanylate cyclase (GGDEF)-like protein